MDEAVKALVKVAVKKEQRTRPVRIHRIPKKRANKDLGTLSPYLREDIEQTNQLKGIRTLLHATPYHWIVQSGRSLVLETIHSKSQCLKPLQSGGMR